MILAERTVRRRLPPYAQQIPASVKTVFISAGPAAWERARRWERANKPGLVCPPDTDPDHLVWPVKGRNVVLIATDLTFEQVKRIARAILAAKPGVLAVLHGEIPHDQLEILKP